jgi:hypothetical protein
MGMFDVFFKKTKMIFVFAEFGNILAGGIDDSPV